MENADSDEPDRKRPHLLSPMARNSSLSPPNNQPVDAAILQYQNQMLVQELDLQKHDLHDLEAKSKELKEKQTSYDDILITVNQLWNQLVDDLTLLGVRAGRGQVALQTLDHADRCRGTIPSCPAEEVFLCRLLEVDSIASIGNDRDIKNIEKALALRHSSTMELMKSLEDVIARRVRTISSAQAVHGKLSAEDAIIHVRKIDDLLKEEADNLREVIDTLHLKHKEYADGIQTYITTHSIDQLEIKRLAGELEESMAELEESRRKFISLKMQKDAACGVHTPVPCSLNGKYSPEKAYNKTSLTELKDSIEETKKLSANRLSEIEVIQEDNLKLSKQIQEIENELKDDKHIHSSRLYVLLNDQLIHWNTEVERYKALTDSLQADKSNVVRREKELNLKSEAADAARSTVDNAEYKIKNLEVQLQKCVAEKNDSETKMEEVFQDLGRKDIKSEFSVMASALSKELGMMAAQSNRWKETAHEAISRREEVQALKSLLITKTNEQKSLVDKCARQMMEIKSLRVLTENLQKERLELQIFVDMQGHESYDNSSKDMAEIKESERRAHSQAELLKNALGEHSLELRVKAANETEAACQQRLSAAETEIADLRAILDASERDVLELTETIRIKDLEAEAYISEIETIGQAYEDMQSQNQRLLQQVTERDDYNIKLVSESVKIKQAHTLLLSEKQALSKQLQLINTSLESVKLRISRSEEQMKACLTEAIKFTQDDRHLAINLEMAKWELADAEKELKWLKSALCSSEKENEHVQRKMDEIKNALDRERSEREKLEEELREMNEIIAEMTAESTEATIQRLQDEIKDCKSILKCGVCFDRPKEVLILKCNHLFCNQCIQRNLEIRHRKCPGCGTAFGQNDVRFVKI